MPEKNFGELREIREAAPEDLSLYMSEGEMDFPAGFRVRPRGNNPGVTTSAVTNTIDVHSVQGLLDADGFSLVCSRLHPEAARSFARAGVVLEMR